MNKLVGLIGFGLLVGTPAVGGPLLDKAKEVGGSAVEIVGETASGIGKRVKGEKESPDDARQRIDRMATETIERLIEEAPSSNEQFDNAAGYAVFDSRRMSLLISAGFGQGVAVDRSTGLAVYMKMATGGVNIGLGTQFYQVVFLFPTATSFQSFVDKGWDANADVDAVAGKDSEGMALRLPDGTAVYKLNEKGVMLSASLTGTRYWRAEELNVQPSK